MIELQLFTFVMIVVYAVVDHVNIMVADSQVIGVHYQKLIRRQDNNNNTPPTNLMIQRLVQ